ncbi:MAG: MarR family transcriptional regulator [Cellulosilyticum sp.]|nr:MarR family transcriptional regulator [Cellulosilyticum sp.]
MKQRTGKLISILYRKSQIYLGRVLKSYNVGAAEVPVLLSLYSKDGVTQEELATHVSLDKSAITRILQSLLSKNYITKSKDENDLRCNRIYLTKEAHAIKETIYHALDDWNALLMRGLEENDQTKVYHLLEYLVDNIKGEHNENTD